MSSPLKIAKKESKRLWEMSPSLKITVRGAAVDFLLGRNKKKWVEKRGNSQSRLETGTGKIIFQLCDLSYRIRLGPWLSQLPYFSIVQTSES